MLACPRTSKEDGKGGGVGMCPYGPWATTHGERARREEIVRRAQLLSVDTTSLTSPVLCAHEPLCGPLVGSHKIFNLLSTKLGSCLSPERMEE